MSVDNVDHPLGMSKLAGWLAVLCFVDLSCPTHPSTNQELPNPV